MQGKFQQINFQKWKLPHLSLKKAPTKCCLYLHACKFPAAKICF